MFAGKKPLGLCVVLVLALLCSARQSQAVVLDTFTFTNVDSHTGLTSGLATGNYSVQAYALSGTLSSINSQTYSSEAQIDATVNSVTTRLAPFNGNTFSSIAAYNHVTFLGSPVSVSTGDAFSFDFLETYIDGLPDAVWDTITIRPVRDISLLSTSGSLGSGAVSFFDLQVLAGGTFQIDTIGSNFDTELALWDAAGNLLQSDDDGVLETYQSLISRSLTAGSYTIAVAGYDAQFFSGPLATAGGAAGNFLLNVVSLDGAARFGGPDEPEPAAVPEPATAGLSLLALAGLGCLLTRRRR